MMGLKMDESLILNFRLDVPFLYKYCGPTGVDILSSLRLKVTPPDQFNDPFEFTPKSNCNFTRDSIKDLPFDRTSVLRMWEEMPVEKRGQIDFDKFYSAFQNELAGGLKCVPQDHKDRIVKQFHHEANRIAMRAPSFLGEHFGVVCLSEVPDDILMWSHYTSKHQGFVLGFDVQQPFIKTGPNLVPVEYSSERALVDISAKGANEDPRTYIPILRRKSLHWAYEREWRLICLLKFCVPWKDPQDKDQYYCPIDPMAISRVVLGKRCSDETKSQVEQAIAKNGLGHVQRFTADIHESDFRLTISPVEQTPLDNKSTQ
jgi:hypothetical protein